jgi:hypothetical protein
MSSSSKSLEQFLQEAKAEILQVMPDWDNFKYQKLWDFIVNNRKAWLEWSDISVGPRGEWPMPENLQHWTFGWQYGFIGLDGFKKEEEELARKAACLFVYLWSRGVEASLADNCAKAYCRLYTFYR